jgi:DNA-binding transcriptional regulator/RsmH inhibitor MraZ
VYKLKKFFKIFYQIFFVCREDLLLLDAVEMFGYGNWKDIARHVESKNEQQVKERYIKRFINGAIGIHTWKEDLRFVVSRFVIRSFEFTKALSHVQ